MGRRCRLVARAAGPSVAAVVALSLGVDAVLAHGGGLADPTPGEFVLPTWLFLSTGGAVVLLSFLLTTVVTDREAVAAVHDWRVPLPDPPDGTRRAAGGLGVLALGFVVAIGFLGPREPLRNAALLLVWVGWWAGLVMAAYLLGNPWTVVDPWRTLAGAGSASDDGVPARFGRWFRVALLLGIVWVELVSPLGENPRLLALAAVGYTLFTVAGTYRYGRDWLDRVDPIASVFRAYGRLAPVQRTDDGVALRVPGSALTDGAGEHGPGTDGTVRSDRSDPVADGAFVVALLWGTTFDGLASTPLWVDLAGGVVARGVPPRLLYLLALVVGFGVCYAALRGVLRVARLTGPTFLAADELERRFAPGLVPIAAGYHLAHYLGYFLALAPALVAVLSNPLSPAASPPTLSLPAWFGVLPLACVLLGHVLAVWIAHSIAYRSFPGHLQAVQSQYPLTALMVGYTAVSLWIVSRPSVTAPYL